MQTESKEALTADYVKQYCSGNDIRQSVANAIGRGDTIGYVIDVCIADFEESFMFTEDFTREQAKAVIRSSLRTCNTNDKKFNAKKYGAAYHQGRLQCMQDMGDGLLRALGRHIKNLNFALENTKFNFAKSLTPKEYASMSKDLAATVSLYQSVAKTYHPGSESTFEFMSVIHNASMLAEIEENAKSVAQQALPSDTTKALPHSSDNPTDETSESGEVSESCEVSES